MSFLRRQQSLLSLLVSFDTFFLDWHTMESFRKYMTFKKDYNELLLYLLRELVKNALCFEEIATGSTSGLEHIDVKVDDLQNKDLKPFFKSSHFSRANFILVEGTLSHQTSPC